MRFLEFYIRTHMLDDHFSIYDRVVEQVAAAESGSVHGPSHPSEITGTPFRFIQSSRARENSRHSRPEADRAESVSGIAASSSHLTLQFDKF